MAVNLKITTNFYKEINLMLDKPVKVTIGNGNFYKGILAGYDINSGTIVLKEAVDQSNSKFSKVIINKTDWGMIFLEKPLFPMKELAERLSKNFPAGQVKYRADSNTISILNDKIIINENGVQGSGPTAQRVKDIYRDFCRELKEKNR